MLMGQLQLSDQEKLQQLRAMIEVGKMEKDDPSKEFKELLSSLSIEAVNMFFFQREKFSFVQCSPGDRHHH